MPDMLHVLLVTAFCLLGILAVGREHDDRCECHPCRRRRKTEQP